MKLYLMRHAQSIGNYKKLLDSRLNYGLSEKGKMQANNIASFLEKYQFDVIIVSPLKRTQETIKPFLQKHHIKLVVSDLTLERDGGIFTGKNQNVIKDFCEKNNLERVSFRPEKGEAILDVFERAKKFVKYLKENYNNKSILIVGHKNFLMCLEIVITEKDILHYYSYTSLETAEIREFNL